MTNWDSIEKFGQVVPWKEVVPDHAISIIADWWSQRHTQPENNGLSLETFANCHCDYEDGYRHPKKTTTYTVQPFYSKDATGKFMYVLLKKMMS